MVVRPPSGGGRAGSGHRPRRTERGAGAGTVACDRSSGAPGPRGASREAGSFDREPLECMNLPPASGRVGPRTDVKGHGSGNREPKPQGREWLKKVTGSAEEQTVKVVGNDEGGPKRVWKPATRRFRKQRLRPVRKGEPGSGFCALGASEGRKNPRKEDREEGSVRRRRVRERGRESERGPRG